MGWNDRLPDCDKFFPSEEERQAYFDWQEYQNYLELLLAETTAQPSSDIAPPECAGLSSQTVDPNSLPLGKDIFEPRPRYVPQKKEAPDGQESQSQFS